MVDEDLLAYRKYFHSISEVKISPPNWVIPGLLVPGMNLVVGDPKTFKSRLVLEMIAAVTELRPVANSKMMVPKQRGSAVYFAAEQSAGRIKYVYEKRILKRELPKTRVSLDFLIAKNAWEWQIDEPSHDKNLAEFVKRIKPSIVVLDPLVYFHSLDENDPKMVKPLVPIREAVLKYGGAFVVVHHSRKGGGNDGKGGGRAKDEPAVDWGRARGTSALWAMADAGIMNTRAKAGTVAVNTEFKDHPPRNFSWKPE